MKNVSEAELGDVKPGAVKALQSSHRIVPGNTSAQGQRRFSRYSKTALRTSLAFKNCSK